MAFRDQASFQRQIDDAIHRLKSLHDGDAGVVEVVGLGPAAVPALREVVFAREPSGLFQPRCRAIEALAALRAFDVLADLLRQPRDAVDPVERLGDDAVWSAAGRALAGLREQWVYQLLVEFAQYRPLPGILAGLGSFHRRDSIPIFVAALGEDDLRRTAETILQSFGKAARPALIAAALEQEEAATAESESHGRKRRSALSLLAGIGISRKEWPKLRDLVDDRDDRIALLACDLCCKVGGPRDRSRLSGRLMQLRTTAGWLERERIDELLHALQVVE